MIVKCKKLSTELQLNIKDDHYWLSPNNDPHLVVEINYEYILYENRYPFTISLIFLMNGCG